MTTPLKVLVIDDHALIAEGVVVALQGAGVDASLTTGPSADDILGAVRDRRPDVVLLDLQLENEVGWSIPLIDPILAEGATVLVVTGVTDRVILARCIEAGVIGIASKSDPFDELVEKVLRAGEGRPTLPKHLEIELLQELEQHRRDEQARLEPFERLSPRESAVLQCLMDGMHAEDIAESSFVSIATVRSQIRSILNKLGVNSQLAAVAFARDAGWELEPAST